MEKGTIIIEPFMYEKLHLTLPEMAVYAIINGYSKNDKNCFVSLIEMAKMTKLNSVSICRILKRLTEKGFIKKNVVSTRKVEYTITPLDELKLNDKTAANASNLPTKCETKSKVSNHIAEENKSICNEMDAINDKPPNERVMTAEEKENAEKRLAAVRARVAAKIENEK